MPISPDKHVPSWDGGPPGADWNLGGFHLGRGFADSIREFAGQFSASLSWVWNNIIVGGISHEVPYPESPFFQGIVDDMTEQLAPVREVLTESREAAQDAISKAEAINTAMTGSFDGDAQIAWNGLVQTATKANTDAIKALEDSDKALENSITALALASMRSGRIVSADRDQARNDGYVRVDNPSLSSACYVTALGGIEQWDGYITAITQWNGGDVMVRSTEVRGGRMVGKDYLYLNKTAGAIEHSIAIYTQTGPLPGGL